MPQALTWYEYTVYLCHVKVNGFPPWSHLSAGLMWWVENAVNKALKQITLCPFTNIAHRHRWRPGKSIYHFSKLHSPRIYKTKIHYEAVLLIQKFLSLVTTWRTQDLVKLAKERSNENKIHPKYLFPRSMKDCKTIFPTLFYSVNNKHYLPEMLKVQSNHWLTTKN